MKKNRLVVFTKNFGSNFTGASLATVNILQLLEDELDEIIIIAKHIGVFNLKKAKVIQVKYFFKAFPELRRYSNSSTYFYSDDHFGYFLKLAGKRFFHTYHGNWPDAMTINAKMFILSFYYIPQYFFTLKFSYQVINVSYYMDSWVRKINPNTVVIRNGIGQQDIKLLKSQLKSNCRIIMVGNIESRKYKLALKVFNDIENSLLHDKIKVDIFGNVLNKRLSDKLSKFSFVEIIGFNSNVNYSSYDLYLSTSLMENLSISLCEALKNSLPVFAFNVGGTNEVINSFENGILFTKKRYKAILLAIDNLMKGQLLFQFSPDHLDKFNWNFAASRYKVLFDNMDEDKG